MTRTWFITGATRGIGRAIAEAALAHGDRVVATGRDPDTLADLAATAGDRLLALKLDVTQPAEIDAAVTAASDRFGAIDILVNNAGYGLLGFFEETLDASIRQQFEVNLFGVMAVTRAVLPGMRAAGRGHIFNISSIAGFRSYAGAGLYCASKHALEAYSEALAGEIAPFGLKLTIVEPGYFRTDFLDPSSVRFGDVSLPAYAEASAARRATLEATNHNQPGDPARLGAAILTLADAETPPLRFLAGSDAVQIFDEFLEARAEAVAAWRGLSASTDGAF